MTENVRPAGLQQVLLAERGRILRFLAARGAGDEAEDVFQDLWQRLSTGPSQPVSEPLSYLFRAAENLMRDRRRSALSRDRRQDEWHGGRAESEPALALDAMIARQRLAEANALLASLGPRVPDVLRRFRLDGQSQAAIARDLGVSLSSVEKDLQKAYRALAKLKAEYDAE